MDVGDITDISNLPKEILEMIFDRLPFRARQNAKSVCRHWLGILLARKYRKQEKIVVRGFYPVEEILDVLSKCNGGLQHLEFQNVYLDAEKFDSSFWITHGAQINELCFRNCTTDPETFMCMAAQCVNLESVYWLNAQQNNTLICSSEALDFLVHINFSHKNLLIFETGVVSLDWLYKFRKVFPNAERMSYVLDSSLCVKGNAKETRRIRSTDDGDELNLPKISEKKLSVGFRNLSVDFVRRTLISAYELRRLQEIEIHADMQQFPRDEFLYVVRQQPHLEKFKFVAEKFAWMEKVNFGESLLEALFETSNELRWLFLDLGESYNLMIGATIFLKIKSSKLSYLWLQSYVLRFEEVLYSKKSYENVQKNSILRHLCVYSLLESVDGFYLLLQSFSRLEHLEINWFSSNEVLKSIITHQSQLRSLRFITQKETPSEQDGDSGYQFHHLEKLKNLWRYLLEVILEGTFMNAVIVKEESVHLSTPVTHISGQGIYDEILMKILDDLKYLLMLLNGRLEKDRLAEFPLPNLEYLYIKVDLFGPEFFEAWLNALARSQKLRALHFCNSQVGIPFESWLKFSSSLKNLEYFCIQGSQHGEPHEQFNEEKFQKLFHASPSLRMIVQASTGCGRSYISAVYDRARERMFISKDPTYSYIIRNSNLDYHYVDWLYS